MWIKICGIRDRETVESLISLKPDALGLNFYKPSPRSVEPTIAREIVNCLPASISPVGLFVNSPVEEIVELVGMCGLKIVQLHGDEGPEQLAEVQSQCPELEFIRVFRMQESLLALDADLQECRRRNVKLKACLVDAFVKDGYGGSGQTLPWKELRSQLLSLNNSTWPPLILAGGLTPENIQEAIQTVKPWGVDVASGVESSRGVKDVDQCTRFIQSARSISDSDCN